mmetsp:Transcript_46385/g.140515  ORF Transcript_46385/g.140515 Transcript_46385/m.140515 type:complete len:124 (-) Transcript_46385:406-777(-)
MHRLGLLVTPMRIMESGGRSLLSFFSSPQFLGRAVSGSSTRSPRLRALSRLRSSISLWRELRSRRGKPGDRAKAERGSRLAAITSRKSVGVVVCFILLSNRAKFGNYRENQTASSRLQGMVLK